MNAGTITFSNRSSHSLTGRQLFAVLAVIVAGLTAEFIWRFASTSVSAAGAAELLFGVMAVFTISSFLVATNTLRRNSKLLQRKVDERTRELQNTVVEVELAKEAAETANQAKSEFLANISHELRTPLHGMLSYARFGMVDAGSDSTEEIKQYFERIHQSGETLLAMVNDLLDLAKFEAGKMRIELAPDNLNDLATFMVDEFRSLCSEKDIQVELAVPPSPTSVVVDAERMKQVLRNLMSNAVKFSPPGSTVRLTISKDGALTRARVSDEGPGVPPDELDSVFEKFVQSSRTKTGAGGTGLGLAICREIANAHNGRVWAENSPDGGAVFTLEIPCDAAPAEAAVG